MKIWLNGTIVDEAEARISVFDAGFQHGVGLFETMLARHGRPFRAEAHLQRLARAADALALARDLRINALAEAVQQAIDANELADARIRLTLTGGNLGPVAPGAAEHRDPTILIVAQPPTTYPDAFFTEGVTVVLADGRANPLDPMAGCKTLNYWPRISALQSAAGKGAGEALWFSVSNHLASGAVSNIFLVKNGDLRTPLARGEEEAGAINAPVLPGITRQTIIELAEGEGALCEKKQLDIDDLLAADEVFLTNSSWGVLPVVRVERETIGDGAVGAITQKLRAAWDALVNRETSFG
jgi:branched-chain amino acid aminotransferase